MEPYLLLERTKKNNELGLEKLKLSLHHPDIKEDKFVIVNSGQAGKQNFRAYDDMSAKPESMEPILEGRYFISNPIYKAPGEDWPEGIGDRTMPLTPIDVILGGRGAFEIHPDANRRWSPGSAGCPATENTDDWDRVAYWVRVLGAKTLYVNWGLKKVKLPVAGKPAPVQEKTKSGFLTVKMKGEVVGEATVINGKSFPSLNTVAKMMGLSTKWHPDTKEVEVL